MRDSLGRHTDSMDARALQPYIGRIVQLTFADGARIRARIVSVDPDQLDNHVIYDVIAVAAPGPNPEVWKRTPLSSGAQRIVDLQATD